jgi:hypothetical protein
MFGNKKNTLENEDGFAAIVIALTLIIVLSLVTVGFADLMNDNQNQATDRQLSNQAYYAAETGVNDAAQALVSSDHDPNLFDNGNGGKKTCKPFSGDTDGLGSNQVGNNSLYSCLLIDLYPSELAYGDIDTTPRVIEVNAYNSDSGQTPASIDTLAFSWKGTKSNGNFLPTSGNGSYCSTLTSQGDWPADTGMMKITIIPINTGSTSLLTRSDLINNEMVAYLCPSSAATSGNWTTADYNQPNLNSGANTGIIVQGDCNIGSTPNYCNARIGGLDTFNSSTFIVAIQSIYQANALNIDAYGGVSGGSALNIGGAQTVVDSTGDSQGIFKRIEARIPDHNNYDYPAAAVQSMSGICKQLAVAPPLFTTDYGVSDGCNETNP